MGINYSQRSPYVEEMRQWELRPVMHGETMVMPLPERMAHPYNPDEHPYPKMLYQAERAPVGPPTFRHLVVQTEAEELLERGQGWHDGQQAALDALARQQTDLANQAANRAYHEQRMTPHAQAEVQAVVEKAAVHLGEIPRKPVRKYVKKVKAL